MKSLVDTFDGPCGACMPGHRLVPVALPDKFMFSIFAAIESVSMSSFSELPAQLA